MPLKRTQTNISIPASRTFCKEIDAHVRTLRTSRSKWGLAALAWAMKNGAKYDAENRSIVFPKGIVAQHVAVEDYMVDDVSRDAAISIGNRQPGARHRQEKENTG